MNRVISPFLIVFVLLVTTIIVIALGRGYRWDFGKKQVFTTGLLVASSDPPGAQIFVNGELKSATNTTLTLAPDWYQVKLVKEGYLPWEKKMKVLGEVVAETQAILFSSTPKLTPLTTTGVVAPVLSPDQTKIVYAVPGDATSSTETVNKTGLWVLNLVSSPFGFSQEPQLLAKSTSGLDYAQSIFSWSPDSKEILIDLGENHYLVKADRENQPIFLSRGERENLLANWQKEREKREKEKLVLFPQEFVKLATESGKILAFSLDATKVLYQATTSAVLPPLQEKKPPATNPTLEKRNFSPQTFYVYDNKEDKNYEIGNGQLAIGNLFWFPTSRHLLKVSFDKISILEYDGTNQVTLYSGPFEKFVAVLPAADKLLILTTLNRLPEQAAGAFPNLYSVDLR